MRRNYRRSRRTRRFRRVRPRRSRMSRTIAFSYGKMRPSRFARRAYRMLNIAAERKMVSATSTGQSISNSWLQVTIPPLGQGPGGGGRIGNKIFARYWRIRGMIYQNGSSNYIIRICVVIPKLAGLSPPLPAAGAFTSQWNIEQWNVLYDKCIILGTDLNTGNVNTGQASIKPWNFRLKIFKTYEYPTNADTYPVNIIPSIYLYANDVLTPFPQFEYSSQFTFSDV